MDYSQRATKVSLGWNLDSFEIFRPEISASLFTSTGCRILPTTALITYTKHTAPRSRLSSFLVPRKVVLAPGWQKKKESRRFDFYRERPNNQAQLRLLFVDRGVRGVGLGRWLVEESIRYCKAEGFHVVYLWTVKGLDRAIWLYESVGFTPVADKRIEEWGKTHLEVRFDLNLDSDAT